MKTLTKYCFYLPASEQPLSADVGVVTGEEYTYVFDVGANEESLRLITGIRGKKRIVLSHFHYDHTDNLLRPALREELLSGQTELFVSAYTKQHLDISCGTVVTEPLVFCDGVTVELLPMPSSHARGCLVMNVNRELTFFGDAMYAMTKNKEAVYNAQLLQEEIDRLSRLQTQTILLSHRDPIAQPKERVLHTLQKIYEARHRSQPYIRVEE